MHPRRRMQIENAREFFGTLAAHSHEPRLVNASGSWQFDVDGAGTWTVKVDKGSLTVAEGTAPEGPTARLSMSEAELVRLADGEGHENPLSAMLRGAIHVYGDLAFAQRLLAIMPVPDDWKEAR
jgi:putative sterol carrier protein